MTHRQKLAAAADAAAPQDTLALPEFGGINDLERITGIKSATWRNTARALFEADVLGWGDYPPDESEIGAVISPEVWASLANDAPELTGPIAVAVDRSQDRKTWSICAAQRTTTGQVHLELSPYQFTSQADVLERVLDIVMTWDPISITIDSRSAAAVIRPALESREVEPNISNTVEMALSAGSFVDSVEAGTLSHSNQQTLNDAVVSATKRDLAGGFAWAAAPGVCNLNAASLAVWSLLSAKTVKQKWSPPPLTAGSDRRDRDEPVELDLMRVGF